MKNKYLDLIEINIFIHFLKKKLNMALLKIIYYVKNNMYYKYDNLSNDYFKLQHEYNIYDDNNNLIHNYLFNKDTYHNKNLDPILHTGEVFAYIFKKIINKLN